MLYIVGTPIGNIKDISIRALEVLESVDLILAEDTRQTIKLLNKYEIKTKMQSYHMHNENKLNDSLLAKLKEGLDIALVSDAGMPLVCDPGYSLVNLCRQEEIELTVVASGTALISALILSGFPASDFRFISFLPKKTKERKSVYEDIFFDKSTIIFYETPHRIEKTLLELAGILSPKRKIALIRELTKLHEEVLVKTLSEWQDFFKDNTLKGEMVVVIEAYEEKQENKNEELLSLIDTRKHLDYYLAKDYSKNEAIKAVAKDRGLRKNDIYVLFND